MFRAISFICGVFILLGILAGCASPKQNLRLTVYEDGIGLEADQPCLIEAEQMTDKMWKIKYDSKSEPFLNLGTLPKMEFD